MEHVISLFCRYCFYIAVQSLNTELKMRAASTKVAEERHVFYDRLHGASKRVNRYKDPARSSARAPRVCAATKQDNERRQERLIKGTFGTCLLCASSTRHMHLVRMQRRGYVRDTSCSRRLLSRWRPRRPLSGKLSTLMFNKSRYLPSSLVLWPRCSRSL